MKPGLDDIIGKTITTVVVAKNARTHPNDQVFLLFADGSAFEFYGAAFSCASGTMKQDLGQVFRYIKLAKGAEVTAVYPSRARASASREG